MVVKKNSMLLLPEYMKADSRSIVKKLGPINELIKDLNLFRFYKKKVKKEITSNNLIKNHAHT